MITYGSNFHGAFDHGALVGGLEGGRGYGALADKDHLVRVDKWIKRGGEEVGCLWS